MPSNSALSWTDLTVFGGLWATQQFTAPQQSAHQMTDCYPLPEGGLHPWYAVADDVTGANLGATVRVLGMFDRQLTGVSVSQVILVQAGTDVQLWNRGNDSSDWTLVHTFDDTDAGGQSAQFCTYFGGLGNPGIAFIVGGMSGSMAGAGSGVWIYSDPDPIVTQVYDSFANGLPTTNLVVHQERLVWSTTDETIHFTAPADDAEEGTLSPNPGEFSQIKLLASYTPSDLVVGTDGPFAIVQGDLADPTTRRMSSDAPASDHFHTDTPGGLAYLSATNYGAGIFLTQEGSANTNISSMLSSLPTAGDLLYLGGFLISGTGLVYHFASQSWFRSSAILEGGTVDYLAKATDIEGGFYTVHGPGGEAVLINLIQILPQSEPSRALTWTWESAPLHSPDGREVVVREVRIPWEINTANANPAHHTIKVNVLDPSTRAVLQTVTKTVPATSGDHLNGVFRFLLRARSQYVSIEVVADGVLNPAPIIESLSIGWHAGHTIR